MQRARGDGRCLRPFVAVISLAVLAVVSGLLAPAAGASPASGEHSVGTPRYLVRRGDTLIDIAAQFGTTVEKIAALNGIGDPNRIYAGTYIVIPSGTGPVGASSAGSGTYTVRPGDNLSTIARRYGLSASALAIANGIDDPDVVIAGRRIVVPGAGSATFEGSPARTLPGKLRSDPGRYGRYAPSFSRWAARYGVPLDLLKGLCWLESGWQPAVVSRTGAIGMCQFMPKTTEFVSGLIGQPMNPWNADENIRMSARYLRYLLDRSGGDVRKAVASYYQGFDSVTARGMYSDTVAYVEGVLAFRQRF